MCGRSVRGLGGAVVGVVYGTVSRGNVRVVVRAVDVCVLGAVYSR